MTNKDFINVKHKDRFHKDYKLTEGEIKFTFFYIRITAFMAVSGLIYWMCMIATR